MDKMDLKLLYFHLTMYLLTVVTKIHFKVIQRKIILARFDKYLHCIDLLSHLNDMRNFGHDSIGITVVTQACYDFESVTGTTIWTINPYFRQEFII